MSKLLTLDAEPLGADVVEILRGALAKAEAGELSSVAIAVVYRDGCTGSSWSKPPSRGLQIGASQRLTWLLCQEMDA